MSATTAPKAIETRYKGYRFRSRLEARWAVFFDAIGRPWEYERQGYALPSGNYLPDFWLPITHEKYPNAGYWLEIKGDEPTREELRLCGELVDATKHHCILLSGPPDSSKVRVWKSVKFGPRFPQEDGSGRLDDPMDFPVMTTFLDPSRMVDGWGRPTAQTAWDILSSGMGYVWYHSAADGVDARKLDAALSFARAARFEHGETPGVNR